MLKLFINFLKLLTIALVITIPLTLLLSSMADKKVSTSIPKSATVLDSNNESQIENEKDISEVKSHWMSYRLMDMPPVDESLDSAVKSLAGVDGSIKWESISSDSHKDNPSIRCVQATIEIPPHGKSKPKHIKVRFLRNRSTEVIKLDTLTVNGKKSKNASLDLMYGID